MFVVHGVAMSPFVRKVYLFLTEKGLTFERRDAVPFPKTPELLEKSPLGKIPFFEDGDLLTPDSSVICAYIERKHPKPALFPIDAKDFARALWFEEYADTKVAEAAGTVYFQRIVSPTFFDTPTDEDKVRKALEEDLPPALAYLEGQITAESGIVSGRFSIADIAMCSPLINLSIAGESIDPKKYPKLASYVTAMTARPAFTKVLTAERDAAKAA